MKKFILSLFAAAAMVSCSSDIADTGAGTNSAGSPDASTPSTEVSIQGMQVTTRSSSANGTAAFTLAGYDGQHVVATGSPAYFFIRIDNRIPGAGSFPSTAYFPQNSNGGSCFATGNTGTVNQNADGVTWKSLNNRITSYLYDTTGKTTVAPLTKIPELSTIIAAHKNRSYNLSSINTDTLKVIWYVTKYEDGIWHVDGVLTGKSTTSTDSIPGMDTNPGGNMDDDAPVTPETPETPDDSGDSEKTDTVVAPGNVEVDIHQQEHQDWTQIKTSIHVRDSVDKVVVEIPLDIDHVAEQDDFAIRTYDFNLAEKVYINGKEYTFEDSKALSVNVEHQATKVVITVTVHNQAYIAALKKEYGDGATIEVSTYGKDITNEALWPYVKQSTVTVTPAKGDTYDAGKLITHISNAFDYE